MRYCSPVTGISRSVRVNLTPCASRRSVTLAMSRAVGEPAAPRPKPPPPPPPPRRDRHRRHRAPRRGGRPLRRRRRRVRNDPRARREARLGRPRSCRKTGSISVVSPARFGTLARYGRSGTYGLRSDVVGANTIALGSGASHQLLPHRELLADDRLRLGRRHGFAHRLAILRDPAERLFEEPVRVVDAVLERRVRIRLGEEAELVAHAEVRVRVARLRQLGVRAPAAIVALPETPP